MSDNVDRGVRKSEKLKTESSSTKVNMVNGGLRQNPITNINSKSNMEVINANESTIKWDYLGGKPTRLNESQDSLQVHVEVRVNLTNLLKHESK